MNRWIAGKVWFLLRAAPLGCLAGCQTLPAGGAGDAPLVISTVPADDASGVALQSRLSIEFNRPMRTSTVSVKLEPSTPVKAFTWSFLDTVLETGPTNGWGDNTVYSVEVTGNDEAGRALKAFRFQFSTGLTSVGCANVSCVPSRADRCEAGACKCGTSPACEAGKSCAKPQNFPDYQCFPNCAVPGTTPQSCGDACQPCDPFIADSCVNGACSCGTQAACRSGQQCVLGQCVCNTSSCSGPSLKGCCDGNTCIVAAKQTLNRCRAGATGLCEDFTKPYSRATSCTQGEARCGQNDGCNNNSLCYEGACLAACSNSNCAGCCENGLCYSASGTLKTSAQQCGSNGENCKAATDGNADQCFNGSLSCGASGAVCLAPNGRCQNGQCECPADRPHACGAGFKKDCCLSGQWCNECSSDLSGTCSDSSLAFTSCDDTGFGTYTSYQVP